VRFTHGPLGLLHDPDDYKFADHVASAGDLGVYEYEHPTLDDWHICSIVATGIGRLYAPVHRGQFEVASRD
jgi:hypothetical protein